MNPEISVTQNIITNASNNGSDGEKEEEEEEIYSHNSKLEFFKESDRLKSLIHWPVSCIDINLVARMGLYYRNNEHSGDTVVCYFCGRDFSNWKYNDCPLLKHNANSTCKLFYDKTANVPLCNLEFQNLIWKYKSIVMMRKLKQAAKYPNYSDYNGRKLSFKILPISHPDESATIEKFSSNGFFLHPTSKKIKCYYCSLTYSQIGGMSITDYHILNSSLCEFSINKYGQEHITTTIKKQIIKKNLNKSRVSIICKICYENNSDFIAIPCGHLVFCSKCKSKQKQIGNTECCPFCNTAVKRTQKIFFP